MVEEILVRNTLTSEMIDAGKELIHQLDKKQLSVNSAFWLFDPESNNWKLIIASPEVKKQGPKKVYLEIQKILRKLPSNKRIALKDISVYRNDDPLIASLGTAITTSSEGISDINLSSTTIATHYIDDALIYRST